MAHLNREQKSGLLSVSNADDASLSNQIADTEVSPSHDGKHLQSARSILSRSVFFDVFADVLTSIACTYFIIFAVLVYARDNQPITQSGNEKLLEAAKYNPTIFPIVSAAIISRLLKAIAAFNLEKGAPILRLEYLLQSRALSGAITAPFTLAFSILTPCLWLLWGLSPLGGQASLRVINTEVSPASVSQNFTYLAFVSAFSNEGVGSASAEMLPPADSLFTSVLIGSAETKNQTYDQYGNVKIPMYETLPSLSNGSDWRLIPNTTNFLWSSLTGLPIHGLPSSGNSSFTVNTGYMTTTCNVSGNEWTKAYSQSLNQYRGWSGANYAIVPGRTDQFAPTNFTFYSLELPGNGNSTEKILTVANCSVAMQYVEVRIECEGQACRSVAVRPSSNPATHTPPRAVSNLNSTYYTPINGLGQENLYYMSFYPDFTNATNPTIGCDTSFCPASLIEAYLVDPINPLSQGTSKIWEVGDEVISQRFTQLINTYWIDSIATSAVLGNFSLANDTTYNTDSTIGTIMEGGLVIVCDKMWFSILLICSLVLLIAGMTTMVLNTMRRGPDILDRLSSLLKDNPHASQIPHHSSMEDAVDLVKRLPKMMVKLGDVHPENNVGYVAIGVLDDNHVIQNLSRKRKYK